MYLCVLYSLVLLCLLFSTAKNKMKLCKFFYMFLAMPRKQHNISNKLTKCKTHSILNSSFLSFRSNFSRFMCVRHPNIPTPPLPPPPRHAYTRHHPCTWPSTQCTHLFSHLHTAIHQQIQYWQRLGFGIHWYLVHRRRCLIVRNADVHTKQSIRCDATNDWNAVYRPCTNAVCVTIVPSTSTVSSSISKGCTRKRINSRWRCS